MTDISELTIVFLSPIVLVMALVMVLSIAVRTARQAPVNDVYFGIIFACALIYSMTHPIDIPSGGITDMRGMLIGAAAALLGPKVGLVTLISGLCLRVYIGGEGVLAGTIAMAAAFAGGVAWRRWISPRDLAFGKTTVLLALLISLQNVAIFAMPPEAWSTLWVTLAPYTTVCNLIGTFVFKYLLDDQMALLSDNSLLEKAADTDHLTGLHNRRSLEKQYPALMADSVKACGMSALYFDIDHFKSINDTHGHLVGDCVLRELTNRVSATLRSRDLLCRLGGDEFVVLLPNLCKGEATKVAERFRLLVADTPVTAEGQVVRATISVGAVWTSKDMPFEDLLHMADLALYEAKDMGRNAVAFKSRAPIIPRRPDPSEAAA